MDQTLAPSLIRQLIAALPGLFASHGIEARVLPKKEGQPATRPAILLDIDVDGFRPQLAVDARSRFTENVLNQQALTKAQLHPRLLVLPTIRPAIRSRLRAMNVNHVDLSGTIFVRAPGVRIDVEGRRGAFACVGFCVHEGVVRARIHF